MIFYTSGHTGILYDCISNEQFLLQGHVSIVEIHKSFLLCLTICSHRVTRSLVHAQVVIVDGCLLLMWERTALFLYGTHTLGMA